MTLLAAGTIGAFTGAAIAIGSEHLSRRRGGNASATYAWAVGASLLLAIVGPVLVAREGVSLSATRRFVVLCALVSASIVDLQCRRIPNEVVLGAIGILGALLLAASEPLTFWTAGGGAAAVIWGIRTASVLLVERPGFGWGDVKLAFVVGVGLGWEAIWGLYLAVVVGAVLGLAGWATGHLDRRSRLAFAPCMAAGVLLAWIAVPWTAVSAWLTG